ncbi:MAG TPA: hypothetical protein VMT20_07070 [Terriglobia bacterium]|nr:hypothetical protein [Terriglobia bacterium]
MELQPASIAQVRQGKKRRITVTEDVGNVVRQIKEIDSRLGVIWDDDGEFFAVVEQDGPKQRIVLTAQELDHRVLHRLLEISSPDYDYVGEMDRMDAQADKEKDHRFSQEVGENAEVMAHALRTDLKRDHGWSGGKIFIPDWVRW